jgi:hypothetical protein
MDNYNESNKIRITTILVDNKRILNMWVHGTKYLANSQNFQETWRKLAHVYDGTYENNEIRRVTR